MRQTLTVLIFLVAVAVFSSGRSTAEDPKKVEPKTENQLVGTWKMVKAKYGGKEAQIPEGRTDHRARMVMIHRTDLVLLVQGRQRGHLLLELSEPIGDIDEQAGRSSDARTEI